MRCRWLLASIAVGFLGATLPAFSQVRPSATESGLPFVVGSGFSNFDVDFGGSDNREDGGALWVDWTIRRVPRKLDGLGIEITARDLSLAPSAAVPGMRYDTAAGGAIYHYPRFQSVRPYGKFQYGFGSVDFPPFGAYAHDTRNFYAMGGGADFHAWNHVWLRVDYEYQRWQALFGSATHLTPNGFTIGPQFDFSLHHNRQ